MPVEAATYIADLDNTFPLGGDALVFNDDQLRLLKSVLKNQFKGSTGNGLNSAITATAAELNYLTGLTSLLKTQLDGLMGRGIILDGVIMYSGDYSNIPSHYKICNGANGTVDLRNKFIYGTNTEGNIGTEGGEDNALNITHNHDYTHAHTTGAVSEDPGHIHAFAILTGDGTTRSLTISGGDISSGSTVAGTFANGDHAHTITVDPHVGKSGSSGADGATKNRPPYYTLAYIQRKL